ncbi:MAG: U32 family peptidase [Calditrichaeota bacterium]|nr:MAG: U32 family peptidase [Calditrichota bacterium]
MSRIYELMAPAGYFPMLVAAVKAGADAVYFGLNDYSMRASSKNFSISDLDEMREISRSGNRDVMLYLTLNTIIYDNEIEKLNEILNQVKDKVDAVICWDHAVMTQCREIGIPFFISTQASVANVSAARFYKQLGAQRVVLARELSLSQIAPISKEIEVECFVHGAMCVAISGRCFMSQFTSEKSANRGECHQNCRRSYTITDSSGNELELENSRVMSAKDLCTLHLIPLMKKAGVTSYKIEGRGRDPRYVDTVTRAYRKALDEDLTEEEIKELIFELKKVFNRSFSNGFYLGEPSAEDFSKAENNEATEIKTYIGKIINYYSKPQVASIQLVADLRIGDEIVIIGNKTGIERITVSSMQKEHSEVSSASKGDEIGIQIDNVRRNDEVYLIQQK